MGRWWENDRSKLAASVRATRRRLRAGFRCALRTERTRAFNAAHMAIATAEQNAEHRARVAERKADEAIKLVSKAVVSKVDDHQRRRFVVEVSVDNRVFLMTRDSRSLMREIGATMARAVENHFTSAPLPEPEAARG
jgi:hypothetical protein